MADNVTYTPTAFTAAADEIGGVKYQRIKLVLGADGAADGDVSSSMPIPVQGYLSNPAATVTRPADTTAYASGDLIANSTTPGSVTPMSFTAARVAAGSFMIRRARLVRSGSGSISVRLHLFTASPTVANGDNGVFSCDQAANYVGAIDFTTDRTFTDGAVGIGVPVTGSDMSVKLASGTTLYGLLEARSAFTPTSAGTFAVTLDVLQN